MICVFHSVRHKCLRNGCELLVPGLANLQANLFDKMRLQLNACVVCKCRHVHCVQVFSDSQPLIFFKWKIPFFFAVFIKTFLHSHTPFSLHSILFNWNIFLISQENFLCLFVRAFAIIWRYCSYWMVIGWCRIRFSCNFSIETWLVFYSPGYLRCESVRNCNCWGITASLVLFGHVDNATVTSLFTLSFGIPFDCRLKYMHIFVSQLLIKIPERLTFFRDQ